jgi:hypothetical protein
MLALSATCLLPFTPQQRHIGRFKDALVAARAYDRAAYFLYGKKAVLNFSMEEAAADQGDVPLFIRQAKEQAEAAAALAAAQAAAEDGSVQLSLGIHSRKGDMAGMVWPTQGSLVGFAGVANVPAWQQQQHHHHHQHQHQLLQDLQVQQHAGLQQQKQVYVLDAYSNVRIALQPTGMPEHQQHLQQQQQQHLSSAWNGTAVSQAAVAAAPGSAPAALTGLDSMHMAVYLPSEACLQHNAVSSGSTSSSTCSSQPSAALLHGTAASASPHSPGDSMLLSAALSAAMPAGMQQQLQLTGHDGSRVHSDQRAFLRQTLENQLQKQQGLGPVPQPLAAASQAAFLQSPTQAMQSFPQGRPGYGYAPPAQDMMGIQQHQAAAAAAGGGVQILRTPQIILQPQHSIAAVSMQQTPQQLQVAAGAYSHPGMLLTQVSNPQQLHGGGYAPAGPLHEYGAAAGMAGQLGYMQQQQPAPITVGMLTSMIQGGALHL